MNSRKRVSRVFSRRGGTRASADSLQSTLYLGLYSLIHLTAGQGYALFLDEPDNYVALPEIQPWLIALADSCGETVTQAVLCSHHPELIDYVGGDRGWLLRREQSGATRAGRLESEDAANGLKLSEVVARGWERWAETSG